MTCQQLNRQGVGEKMRQQLDCRGGGRKCTNSWIEKQLDCAGPSGENVPAAGLLRLWRKRHQQLDRQGLGVEEGANS